MLISSVLAVTGLLLVFGLAWPEKGQWLKWPVRIIGILGTLFVAMMLWALSVTGRMALEDGQVLGNWDYLFGSAALLFCFWGPALGLRLGRALGRFVRWLGQDIQEDTHL